MADAGSKPPRSTGASYADGSIISIMPNPEFMPTDPRLLVSLVHLDCTFLQARRHELMIVPSVAFMAAV